jgi:FixJ family two-component response regulator
MSDLIYIVDDDMPFRTAIVRLLQLRGYSVAQYESADLFLEQARGGLEPGCILLDVKLPGLTGPGLQEHLSQLGSAFPIVFLTGHGDVPTTVRAIKAGAEDVLTKPVSEQSLIDSIKRAFANYQAEHAKAEQLKSARARLETLSPREREVFEHVARGKTNKQTARELGITERTIKAHRERIFWKLGAKTVADLVTFAERLGILVDQPLAEYSVVQNHYSNYK